MNKAAYSYRQDASVPTFDDTGAHRPHGWRLRLMHHVGTVDPSVRQGWRVSNLSHTDDNGACRPLSLRSGSR